jgi:hypothetical protein
MGLPTQAVSLSPEEVAELDRRLAEMRHSINNHLTLVVTALELIRRKPDAAERLAANLVDQPQRIREDIGQFSQDLEKALRITRD